MTATERVRELLDERGVEYVLDEEYGKKYPPEQSVTWSCDLAGEDMTVTARDYFIGDGEYCLDLEFHEVFTPEQAIAATLGESPRLPYWWTHDGTLHVELPKLPESISVRLPDERDREVGSARVWQYTLDSGTCHPIISDNLNESEGTGDAWANCSECGHLLFVLTDPNSEPPNYCPNCGRKVVEPTTNDVDAEVGA